MSFVSGSISFRRFAVLGDAPALAFSLDRLAEYAFHTAEIGMPEDVEYGWSGGKHLLDATFSHANNVYANCLVFGLRIDNNKPPAALKRAYAEMEEQSLASENASGFISKAQKRHARDAVQQRIENEMRSGLFRRSRVVQILWDVDNRTLYAAASGRAYEMLAEIFERSFGVHLMPLTSGSIALRHLEPLGRRRDYEDLRPTRFVPGPEGDGQHPEYPWVLKGLEPKDFLGNEFLMSVWHATESSDGEFPLYPPESKKTATVFIDRTIDLECAYGQTGKDSIRGDGPGRSPEARKALLVGKVPRRMTMLVNVDNSDFPLTISAESMAISALKLPDIEDAETPRILFEERIALLRIVCATLDGMFRTFVLLRTGQEWGAEQNTARSSICRWIAKAK